MHDRSDKNISGNNPGDNYHISRIVPGSKGGFCVRRLLLILLLILFLPVSSSVAENLTCSSLPLLMGRYLTSHYAIKNMTGEIETHAIDQMIKSLDPSKTLLYESDVERLKPLLRDVFAIAQEGNCDSLRPVYDVLVARTRENEAIVKKILGPDYHLDEKVELDTDVKKRPYVQTAVEKQEILKKVVQF
jgi:carboxyl-terminal processing protease